MGATKTDVEAKQVAALRERSSNELKSLSSGFAAKVSEILMELEQKRWSPVVFHGRRTARAQAAKVTAGVSKTLASFHVEGTSRPRGRWGLYWDVKGEAVDIVDARYLWAGPAADVEFPFWSDLGRSAKVRGLRWGGDWKSFKDVAHVEAVTILVTQDARSLRA